MVKLNLLYLLLLLLILSACSRNTSQTKTIITLSVPPQEYFVRQLAGDHFDINVLIRPGADHDSYEPSPEQIMKLSESKAFIGIGTLGFELAWHEKLPTMAPSVQFFYIETPTEDTHHHEGHNHGHHHHKDPHIWLSGEGAAIMAEQTAHVLKTIDPDQSTLYDKNLALLNARIDSVHGVWKVLLAPYQGESFIIYHPSLTWYAPAFGLTQLALEEEGKQLSPAHMAEVVDKARRENIKVVLVQPEYNRENAAVVARESGATVFTIDPMGMDWVATMDNIGNALLTGFSTTK